MSSAYIIGDVHGMYFMLTDLLQKIYNHRYNYLRLKSTPAEIIFVGDYIDRGPDSEGVVNLVRLMTETPPDRFHKVTALKGNHEDLMVASIINKNWSAMHTWVYNGGIKAIESFGKDVSTLDEINPSVLRWMSELPLYYEVGSIAVSHANIPNSDMRASDHTHQELVWSRNLREHQHDHYKYTVHGHTPMEEVQMNEHTAYIDTGAVFGGTLTCLFIEDVNNPSLDKMELIQTKGK